MAHPTTTGTKRSGRSRLHAPIAEKRRTASDVALSSPPGPATADQPQDVAASPRAPFKIALIQIAPALGNLQRNRELHLDRIAAARDLGADLIVFPELSLTGYFLRDQVPDVAQPADGPLLAELIEAAAPAALVVGFVEESPHHRFYNTALWAEEPTPVGSARRPAPSAPQVPLGSGELQAQTGVRRLHHVHRKVYLPTYGMFDEQRYFAAGRRITAFDSPRFGRVGLIICEDLWHPFSVGTVLEAEEIDLLVVIANSPVRGVADEGLRPQRLYDLMTRFHAMFLGVTVVFVNRVGYEDGVCFWGGSRIVDPDTTVSTEAPLFDEALVVGTFDRALVRRERIFSPLGRDERLLLTLEELKRIRRARYAT